MMHNLNDKFDENLSDSPAFKLNRYDNTMKFINYDVKACYLNIGNSLWFNLELNIKRWLDSSAHNT